MPTVFVETKDGALLNRNCYASWEGFTTLGYDVRTFAFREVADLPLTGTDTIVHGRIASVKQALLRIGVSPPAALRLPPVLYAFYGRAIQEGTLGDIRAIIARDELKEPVFIKPSEEQKLFTGYVAREYRDLLRSIECEDATPIQMQEVVEFVSEWRVFVLDGDILNASHYRGDPLVFPDAATITQFVSFWKEAPCAFSADFGIVRRGEPYAETSLLVEVNDAFALGAYGLNSVAYARMIEARWREMCAGGAL